MKTKKITLTQTGEVRTPRKGDWIQNIMGSFELIRDNSMSGAREIWAMTDNPAQDIIKELLTPDCTDIRNPEIFRRELICALAGNGEFMKFCIDRVEDYSKSLIGYADAIIKELTP